jgi:DNA-binding response OmpR family regulator
MTRLLLVEDDHPVRRMLVTHFEQEGFVVEAHADVAGARAATRPDVMLLDHHLARGATHADIVACWPGVPYVVISGSPRPAGHAGRWVEKPLVLAELLATVQAAATEGHRA